MAEPSTPVLILQNLKRASLDFLDRFKPPADIKAACRTLLKDLGFTDPGNIVSDALADLASNWDALRNQLSGIQLEGAEAIDTLTSRGRDISTTVGKLLDIPDAALSRFGASANAIKTHFPRRLVDYVVYDFLTRSHPVIGGAFLTLGVLRRETQAAGDPALIPGAMIRVFDLQALIDALKDPYGSMTRVLHWGEDDFNARVPIDGIGLLIKTVASSSILGPDDDVIPLVAAGGADGEDNYVPVNRPGLKPSARLVISVPGPGGTMQISLIGLHQFGLAMGMKNPFNLNASAGSLKVPSLPAAVALGLKPGPLPKKEVPVVTIFPED